MDSLNSDLRMLAYVAGQVTGKWWTRLTAAKLVEYTQILSWADKLAGLA